MDNKGGRVSIEINGRVYSARGEVTIMGTTISLENGVNRDGSGYSTVKPELARMECTFDPGVTLADTDGGPLIDSQELLLSKVNVSVVEDDTGVSHLFTNARFSGRPSRSTENGEISGLAVETDRYQRVS